MEARLSPGPLAEVLERRRERCNARFRLARRANPALDPRALAEHLVAVVDPLARAVAATAPDRAEPTALVLYDLSLELLAKDVFGPNARRPAALGVWTDVLPAVAPLLAREPARVAASLTNAALRVSGVPGARPAEWLACIRRAGPACASVDELLAAGLVAAWRAGLAHARERALEAIRAGALSLPAALVALGRPDGACADLASLAESLADPWRAAGTPPVPPALACVARVGGFRGFGGPFVEPPEVFTSGGRLCVADAEGCWSLHADAFGATLLRRPRPAADPAAAAPRPDRQGAMRWQGVSGAFPFLAEPRAVATDGTTLAVAVERSHFVFLVARVGG